MFSTLRTRFGIPGVISVMALVFAMFGGAYAASNSSDGGGKATASAKAKKGPRGPKGAKGDTGPAGPAGPQGPAGAKGDAGANGSNGSTGAPGAAGQSVTSVVAPPEPAHCETGGVKLTSTSGVNYVCNGQNGAAGPAGSPWTAGGTLPTNATEKGLWSMFATTDATQGVLATISFGIPLAAALDENHTVLVNAVGADPVNPDPTHCTGTVAEPKAASGYLCVYLKLLSGVPGPPFILQPDIQTPGAGPAGAVLAFEPPTSDPALAYGSWAVTG